MTRYCSSCGSLLGEGVVFCGNCGTKNSAPVASPSTPPETPWPASTAPIPSAALPPAPSVSLPTPSPASPMVPGAAMTYGSQAGSAAAFHQAAEQYRTLLARHQRGEFDLVAFEQAVAALRVTDETGAIWQVHPQNGSWLKWSGSAWIPSTPPSAPQAAGISQPAASSMFDKTAEQYHALLARHQRGELDLAAFEQAVAALRVTDETGAIWQVHPQNGSWLKWSGSAWMPSNPPAESGNKGLGSEVAASLKGSAKSILSQLPRMMLNQLTARLPVAVLTGLSVWAMHSILLVWKNQGFNFQEPWGPYINSMGGTASAGSAAVIWGVPLALIWSTIFSLFRSGPTATFKSFAAGPSQLLRVPRSGNNGLAGFIIGGGIGLFFGSFFRPQRTGRLPHGALFGIPYSRLSRHVVVPRAVRSLDERI